MVNSDHFLLGLSWLTLCASWLFVVLSTQKSSVHLEDAELSIDVDLHAVLGSSFRCGRPVLQEMESATAAATAAAATAAATTVAVKKALTSNERYRPTDQILSDLYAKQKLPSQ